MASNVFKAGFKVKIFPPNPPLKLQGFISGGSHFIFSCMCVYLKMAVCVLVYYTSFPSEPLLFWAFCHQFFPGVWKYLCSQWPLVSIALVWLSDLLYIASGLTKWEKYCVKQLRVRTLGDMCSKDDPCDGEDAGCFTMFWEIWILGAVDTVDIFIGLRFHMTEQQNIE